MDKIEILENKALFALVEEEKVAEDPTLVCEKIMAHLKMHYPNNSVALQWLNQLTIQLSTSRVSLEELLK